MNKFEARLMEGDAMQQKVMNSDFTRQELGDLIWESMLGDLHNMTALACGMFAMMLESKIFGDDDVKELLGVMHQTNLRNKILEEAEPTGNG